MAPVCEDEDEELPLLDASTPAVAVETTVWVMTDVYVDPLGDVPLHRDEERRREKNGGRTQMCSTKWMWTMKWLRWMRHS